MFNKKRKLNVMAELKDEIFLANQVDLRFYPDMFKLEFKQMNQQVDRVGDDTHPSLIINRRSIALTPLMMKQFVGLISKVLINYEEKHGEIKMPKTRRKRKVKVKKSKSSGYIG